MSLDEIFAISKRNKEERVLMESIENDEWVSV